MLRVTKIGLNFFFFEKLQNFRALEAPPLDPLASTGLRRCFQTPARRPQMAYQRNSPSTTGFWIRTSINEQRVGYTKMYFGVTHAGVFYRYLKL